MNFHLEHHIAELLYRSIRGELSDFERQELNQWRSDSPMHETLFMRLQDDGYIDEFIFKGKRIVALNVCDYRIKFLNQIMILLITQKFIYKLKKWSLKKWLK